MEDNRFSTMMPKGINTYDADATDQDILQGKTAYVAGQKITGVLVPSGGGGDWERIGEAIDIEAESTISAGQRIVARENSSAGSRTVSKTSHNLSIFSYGTISYDKSVALSPSGSYFANGVTLTFYFRNEENGLYDTHYDVTISDYTSSVTNLTTRLVLSEDGTIGFASYASGNSSGVVTNCAVLFRIDKENHTVSYSYTSYSSNDHIGIGTDTTHYRKIVSLDSFYGIGAANSNNTPSNNAIVKYDGNYYLVGKALSYRYNISDDTLVSENPKSSMIVLKITNNGFTREYFDVLGSNSVNLLCNHCKLSGSNLYYTAYYSSSYRRLNKYSFTSNSVTQGTVTIENGIDSAIYGDSLYMAKCYRSNNYIHISRYQINTADLTLNLVDDTTFNYYSSNLSLCILSENGSFAYIPTVQLICDFNTQSSINTITNTSESFFYQSFTQDCLVTQGNIFAINPSTNAQYLASVSSDDCTTADRIYGVATQDMVVGTRGTGRALFSTMSS